MKALEIIFWVGYVYTLYLFTPLEDICTENAVCVQEMLKSFTGAYLAVTFFYFVAWVFLFVIFNACNDTSKKRTQTKKEKE